MDQIALVEQQVRDGAKLVEQLIDQGFPVVAAFWLKTTEDSKWYMYIVSPAVDAGIAKAYREVHQIIRQLPEPFNIDVFDVKLIGPTNPIAASLAERQRRTRNNRPVRSVKVKSMD